MVSTNRPWLTRGGLAAVMLLPLAFTAITVAAVGQPSNSLEAIPVAVVNEDSLQVTTAADGTEQNVFAGRLLVTELTGADGFDWVITNAEAAEAALDSGEVYAVIVIPDDFSTSILSLSGASPQKADISISTDDSHGYLTGSVAQVVGATMAATFGNVITAQYIGGVYASLGELGASLGTAADGSGEIAEGASALSTGIGEYTGGVEALSSGLGELDDAAAGLSRLSSGVGTYTSGISQLSATLAAISPGLQATAADPVLAGTLQAVVDGLAQAAAGGQALSAQAASGISGVQYGISESADGAARLAAGSSAIVDGAGSVASGANSLAAGLRAGADQVAEADPDALAESAGIAADPVSVSVETTNPVTDVGQMIATFAVPAGLWIGALAVFLVLRSVARGALASTARNGRIVASAMARASVVTVAQAILLVVLLHAGLGVAWNLIPLTLGFSVLVALAFTAVHHALTVRLGRAGLVVSLFLLGLQLVSTGGIYPVELLSAPFRAISALLPLTHAVDGMQAIISGGDTSVIVASAAVLIGIGVASVLLSLGAVSRMRGASAIGMAPTAG